MAVAVPCPGKRTFKSDRNITSRPAEPALSRAEPALCSREVFAGRVGVGVGERGDTSRSAQGKEAMV